MEKVLWLAKSFGLYTKGVKEKTEAVRLIRAEVEHEQKVYEKIGSPWDYPFSGEDITDESVKETRYYQHKSCGGETIGDENSCYHCGEPCGTGGRKTFAYIT